MNTSNNNSSPLTLSQQEGTPDTVKQTVNYEVGYKKPPKHSQFKKGHSGNKKGRPKGAKGRLSYILPKEKLKEMFMDEAYRMINIRDGNKDVTMPISKAVLRSLAVKAAKGSINAQKLFTKMLLEVEAQNRAEAEDNMTFIIEYKKHWTEVLANRKEHGIDEPDPVPHPDNIILDMARGTVSVKGPLCEEDKAKEDYYRNLLHEWEAKQSQYEKVLSGGADEIQREHLEFMLVQSHKIIPMLQTIIGDETPQTAYEITKELGGLEFD